MLEVRLIGTFSIKCDNKSVTLTSRAAQSLFAYLILTAGTFHRREKLAGMFWPDAKEEKARAYLRHELWRIRKALPSSDFLIADGIGIGFDTSQEYQLDAEVLEKTAETASTDELITSLSAYQGELLPGFYDEWVVLEREHLQAIFEQKMARLLDLLEREKRWLEMVEWAERWIAMGQGPEAAYRALMIAYSALEDHAKVASSYERCVKALEELGLEPSEETRAAVKKRGSKIKIPIPLTSFIGRENELKEVAALLSKSRLVTLTGSGGVGKTRLAIQVVAEVLELFSDGVWFLDLAPLSDATLVPNTLAKVLGLNLSSDSNFSTTEQITGYLGSRRALIIFDNCEHLIEPCAHLVHPLLTACENLTILVTSREALRVSGEIPFRVPSLELPSWNQEFGIDALAKTESLRLFTERAALLLPEFSVNPHNMLVIAQICQRLDGIPLAIELAAARVNMLTVDQILNRLDDRFNLLTGVLRSALPRHRTLRATIEWSYDLLSEKERLLFQRLAVFTGGWTLEAAEAVCSGDGIETHEVLDLLAQLVDKSLVLAEAGSYGTRYRRLETIRQFACETFIVSRGREQIRTQHLSYFLKLAQRAEKEYVSEKMIEWMERIEEEQENIRVSLEWSLQGNVITGQKLVAALVWFWRFRGPLSEGYDWLEKTLAAKPEAEAAIRAKLLSEAGSFASLLGYSVQSTSFLEESLALYRQLGDKDGMSFALYWLGTRAFSGSDFEKARALFEESCALAREVGSKMRIASALTGLAVIGDVEGNFAQAQKFYEEKLMLVREMRHLHDIGSALYFMGNLAFSQGDYERAMELYTEALQIMKKLKNKRYIGWILGAMGSIAISNGNFERSRLLFEKAMEINRQIGDQAGVAHSLHYLACGALLQGDYARGRSLYIENLKLLHHLGGESDIAEYLIGVGLLFGAQDHLEVFARLDGTAVGAVPNIHRMPNPFFRTETEKLIKTARTALGDKVYTAAWEAGRQMNLQEGIAYALRELRQLDSKYGQFNQDTDVITDC